MSQAINSHLEGNWKEIKGIGGEIITELSEQGSTSEGFNWILDKNLQVKRFPDSECPRSLAEFDIMYRALGVRIKTNIACALEVKGTNIKFLAQSGDMEEDGSMRWDEGDKGSFSTFYPWQRVSLEGNEEGEKILLEDNFPLDKFYVSFQALPSRPKRYEEGEVS